MGLFSKKTIVCKKCGKEYQCRVDLNGGLCNECFDAEQNARAALDAQVGGYAKYARDVLNKEYTVEELNAIITHRTKILDKCHLKNGITRNELTKISEDYKSLTDAQTADIVKRVKNSMISSTMGSVYAGDFFIPTQYDNLIVDGDEVFAVGYTNEYKFSDGKSEVLLCVVFTNDQYVPVFPMIFVAQKGFFDVIKSRKGRDAATALFELMCPNLKYPVSDLKQLKKVLKQEDSSRGTLDKEIMLRQISDAGIESGIFNVKKMHSDLFEGSEKTVNELGYIHEEDVAEILKLGKLLGGGRFWTKVFEKYN